MTDETARLVVAVDSTSAGKASDVLDTMTASAGNAEAMVEALSKAFGPVAAEIAKLTAAIDRQVSSYANLSSAGQQVAASSDQAARSAAEQTKATEALGETADEARERIRAMVQASMDQVRADAAAIEATQRRGEATRSTVTDLNAQVAASRRAQEAAEAYRQRSSASAAASRDGAEGTDAQRAALDKLLKQIDPTIAALERLDKQEEQLGKAKAAGLIGGDDFDRFAATIQQRRKDIGDAGEALHGFSLNSAAARREFGQLVGELARGDLGNFQSSLITMANNTGLLSAALSAAGIAVGALAAGVGLLAVAAASGYNEEQELIRAITATGDAAGVTTSQVNGMVAAIGGSTGQYGRARDALQGLIESGKVAGDALQQAGQLAVDMAAVTGRSIEEAVAHIVSLRDDPLQAVKALDSQYKVLTATQYEHIKWLVEQGQQERAVAEIQEAEATAFEARRRKIEENLGYLERAWLRVRSAISATIEQEKQVGSGSAGAQLNLLNQRIADLKRTQAGGAAMSDQDFAARLQDQGSPLASQFQGLLDKKHQITVGQALDEWVAQQSAYDQRVQDEGKRASDTLDDYARRAKADEAKAADIAKVKEATQKALAARPQDRTQIEAQQAAALKYIEDQYTDKSARSAAKALDSAEVTAEAAKFKAALGEITTSYTNAQRELDAQHKAGAVSESAYYQQSRDLLWRSESEQVTAIQAEMARLQQRKVAGAERVKNDQRIAELSSQAHKVEADAISRDNVLVQEEAAARERTSRAIQAYVDALGRQEAAARADADLQVQRLSMGDQEFANMQRLIAIRRQGADELVRLAAQLRNKQIDQATYDQQAAAQQAAAQQASTDRLVQIEEDAQARIAAARADWTTGASRAMANLDEQATDTASSFASFVMAMDSGLANFLGNAATTGTAQVKSFVSSVLTELARLETNRLASSLLSYGLGLIMPGSSSTPSTTTTGDFSLTGGTYGGSGSFATTWGGYRANGGSTSPNSAYRVAEQGPEVYRDVRGQTYLLTGDQGGTVQPMQRGSGTAAGGGGVTVPVTVNIYRDGSSDSEVDASQAGAVAQNLQQQMEVTARRVLAESMRPGGQLWRQRG